MEKLKVKSINFFSFYPIFPHFPNFFSVVFSDKKTITLKKNTQLSPRVRIAYLFRFEIRAALFQHLTVYLSDQVHRKPVLKNNFFGHRI